MRRTILIVPELAATPGGDSVLRQELPSLRSLAENGSVFKLQPVPRIATPEALYLGLSGRQAQMAQGPLTVAALGADPPDLSVHFHLSLMTVDGDALRKPSFQPTAEEEQELWGAVERLNTKKLTLLKGERLDHGLVWEGRGDFLTVAPQEEDLSFKESLPQGDAEVQLRRLIDDSVNILTELEMNQRRIGEGQAAFNVLWPWGHGVRVKVPNLALQRGEPIVLESSSMRLQGLTRLAGYRHVDRHSVGCGMKTKFADVAKRCLSRPASIVLLEGPKELRQLGRLEELEWYAKELDRELLAPLTLDAHREKSLVVVLAPSEHEGIGLVSAPKTERPLPFDERVLEERLVPFRDLEEVVDSGLVS